MTTVNAGEFEVELFKDELYSFNAADNVHQYDFIHISDEEYSTARIGIKTYHAGSLLKSALISASGEQPGFIKHRLFAKKRYLPFAVVIPCFVCHYLIYRCFGKQKLTWLPASRFLNWGLAISSTVNWK